jgi:ATP-binding cassette, subfamily B, bacterial PglK
MKNIINKLLILVDKKNFISLFFILIGIVIAGILDVISISIIPIFISLVVQPDIFISNVSKYIDISKYFYKIHYNDMILYISVFLLLLFFIKSLFQVIIIYFENLFLLKLTTNLGHKIFSNLLYKPYSFHTRINKSVIINTLSTELDRTRFYIWAFINVIKDCVLLGIFSIVLIYWIGFAIPFISIVFLGIVGISVYKLTRSNIQKRGEIALKFRQNQNKSVSHALSSIKEVIVYKSQNFFSIKFDNYLKGNQIQQIFNAVFNFLPRPILEIASLIIILSIISYFIRIDNSNNILATISLLAVSLIRILPAVNSITASLLNMKFNSASVDIICKQVSEIKKKKIDKNKINNFSEINFRNVSFVYENKKEILTNINFTIKAGTTNAIIGSSGSGKTTLINLLLGFSEPSNGKIYLDNNNLKEYLNSFRNFVSYVPQSVYLMEDTIIKNIAFASEDINIDYNKIINICKITQLDEFINTLEHKYETKLGEHGTNISGGQIQRLGIARALYRNPKLIILDESTSALDLQTEKLILDNLLEMKEKLTIIFISHRLTSINNFDNILKIENKKIFNQKNINI